MPSPTVIDNPTKIGIGTYPVYGQANMLAGVSTLQANWFYTWGGQLPEVETTGWSIGAATSIGGDASNNNLKLGSGVDAWAFQELSVASNQSVTLGFTAATPIGSSGGVVLNYIDSSGYIISSSYQPVHAGIENYALEAFTPSGTVKAKLIAYTATGSGLAFDDFSLRAAGTDFVRNGGFDQISSPNVATAKGFVPMVWGAADMSNLASITSGSTMDLLTFNEPDNRHQANLTVKQALGYWPELMASGKRLGSPATTTENTLGENSWLGKFMAGAEAANYRVDFVAVHYYTTNPSVEAFKAFLEKVYEAYEKPIWVTEWSLADWTDEGRFSEEQQQAFFVAATHMMDDLTFVERHAWFSAYDGLDSWDLNTGLLNIDGSLTAIGNSFFDLSGPIEQPIQAPPELPELPELPEILDVAPIDAILSTERNEVLMGTAAKDIFFFDTASGAVFGNDTIRGFSNGDRIVTTSLISDPDNDGRIKANSSDRLFLPASETNETSSSGTIRIFNQNGKAVSNIVLVDTYAENGHSYYVYGARGDHTPGETLSFASYSAESWLLA